MAANAQKLKLLWLLKILSEETDEEAGLTMPQIIEKLAERGVSAERKGIYRDIEALREFGLDIAVLRRSPVQYALASREFSLPELRLLADAVQSSRFLTEAKSEELLRSLGTLASKRQAGVLERRVHVEGRIGSQGESVLRSVDCVSEAMRQGAKVEFAYGKRDASKTVRLRREGRTYVATPVRLVYSDGSYYLVTYNDEHRDFTTYRVDRMVGLRVSQEPASRNEKIATFDAGLYEKRAFGMYGGRPVAVTLSVDEQAMDGVVDRFGEGVESYDQGDGTARVHVTVMESPVFFAWVAQFAGAVRIVSPGSLADRCAEFFENIAQAHRER